ncbi:serine hydrolase [Chitinophaga sp. MM2321]|uniref:serine hydrolase n=1 Tax=Chitinophaga sp. MM2321 TaxID=3137178 RepID=UPI0032D5775A
MKMRYLFIALSLLTLQATAQNKTDSLQRLFDTLVARNNFNGCVLVAEEDKPIYKKAFGYADQEKGIPLNTASLFELASVSKQFTAMAIMQLQEKGKLSYEDSLQKYFPALPYRGVTIRNLLTHTSGITEFLGWNQQQLDTSRFYFNEDIVKLLPTVADSAAFRPGSKFSYSNTNYLLLAQIVAIVSGESFADYMQQHVFIPAGMKNTHVYSRLTAKNKLPNYALSYSWSAVANDFIPVNQQIEMGYRKYLDPIAGPYGISSNVEDLLKWDQALNTEKLVSRKTQEEAYAPFPLENGFAGFTSDSKYGFGWIFSKSPLKGNMYWHTGGLPGYTSVIARYPDTHKTIIVLCNYWNMASVVEIMSAIDHILWGEPYKMPTAIIYKRSISITNAQALNLEGKYTWDSQPGVEMYITSKGNHVYARLTNQAAYEIYPDSVNSFFYTVVAAKIKFDIADDGKPVRLTLFQNGLELKMTRQQE